MNSYHVAQFQPLPDGCGTAVAQIAPQDLRSCLYYWLNWPFCCTNYVWYKRSKKLVQLYTQLILEKGNKDGVFFAYVNTLESQRHGLMRPMLLGIHQYNVFTYELSTDMEHAIYFRLVPHLWFFTKWRGWPLSAQMPINQLVACIAMA